MSREKILVIDDEEVFSELIGYYLTKEGFQVTTVANGEQALSIVREQMPHLVILDIILPGMDGYDVCRELRKITDVPILLISCKTDDIDKIIGFSIGGDDYVVKPYNPEVMVARVKAHLRRYLKMSTPDKNKEIRLLSYPGLVIDFVSHDVQVNGYSVTLSSKEFQLLSLLARNPNRVFDISELFGTIWNYDSISDTRTVMVHICKLRKKIESRSSGPKYILTVRGVGYKFNGMLSKAR